MNLNIRWAASSDVNSLLKLDTIAHKEFPEWWDRISKNELKAVIGRSKFNVMVAIVDGKTVGFTRGLLAKCEGGNLLLDDEFVVKVYRGKGIGKKMMKIFLAKWKGKAKLATLYTKDFNVKKFERMGFKKKMNTMSRKI